MTRSTLLGWAICAPTSDGPMISVRSMLHEKTGRTLPEVPLVWGPHGEASAQAECALMNAELLEGETFWTVEPVAITAGSLA